MHKSGIFIIIVACLIPLIWLLGIGQGRELSAVFSQYLGLLALITMAIAQIIATRWRGIETIFGPMDQSYRLHKWLGISALVFILLHDTIDADMRGLGPETGLTDVAETAGEISLYGLIMLVMITIATFIPYHLWRWTHKVIGAFFVLGAFHYLFILKPFSNTGPLGWYMLAICLLGTLAYIYRLLPARFRPSLAYRIDRLKREGQSLAIEMTPVGRAMNYRAGQFAFFAFSDAGLDEPHPFTLSKAPSKNGDLRVTIAPLGDLTSRLTRALAEGQSVQVDGPWGRFGRGASGPQVWIAAGIGITPFLALAGAHEKGDVTLIYAVGRREDAAHLAEIEALAREKSGLELVLWESAGQGRLTAENVAALAGPKLSAGKVLFCGPSTMRKALQTGLRAHGVSPRRFHYEAFEIRTGIGLKALLEWLWTRKLSQRLIQGQPLR